MTDEKRIQALRQLGAADAEMEALLDYTKNAFLPSGEPPPDELSANWPAVWDKAKAACDTPPMLEMFASTAGTIPIVYPANARDFESLLSKILFKGGEVPDIDSRGASFVYGKTVRFIILSGKPYSGIPAADMELDEQTWMEKSTVIRKYHECAHYYTKRFFDSSRNNLHDELIADFCGIYAAFGEYRAAWFLKFFDRRLKIYTDNLSAAAAEVIRRLAAVAAKGVEEWTKTESFTRLDEAGRIEYLAGIELLEYVAVNSERNNSLYG